MDITIKKLLAIAINKNYKIYDSNEYDLNIWGIRSNNTDTSRYNDKMVVFRKCKQPSVPKVNLKDWQRTYDNGWSIDIFTVTTDPSNRYLLKPLNSSGTAIVVPGQYINLWKKGFHQSKKDHPALRQVRPISVYRDNTRDFKLDYCGKIETGLFGINCHRAGSIVNDLIGLNSAGCQVHKNKAHFEQVFLWLIDKAISVGIEDFTYTLITENEL